MEVHRGTRNPASRGRSRRSGGSQAASRPGRRLLLRRFRVPHDHRFRTPISRHFPLVPPVRTMAELVAGMAAILDAEGIPSASVFGHSLGAGVAHAFTRRYPQRVDKLILSGFGLYTRGHTRLMDAFVRVFSLLPKSALAAFYRPRIARLAAGAEENERASSAPTRRTSSPPTPGNLPWRAWQYCWTWRHIRTVTPGRPSSVRRTSC